jgi:hypothetical protein
MNRDGPSPSLEFVPDSSPSPLFRVEKIGPPHVLGATAGSTTYALFTRFRSCFATRRGPSSLRRIARRAWFSHQCQASDLSAKFGPTAATRGGQVKRIQLAQKRLVVWDSSCRLMFRLNNNVAGCRSPVPTSMLHRLMTGITRFPGRPRMRRITGAVAVPPTASYTCDILANYLQHNSIIRP